MSTKIHYAIILQLVIGLFFLTPVVNASVDPEETTYSIYGGWNDYDTFDDDDWTAGSDNVVWNFGNKETVYRKLKSLSLRYNPGGEFHMTTEKPFSPAPYKWLSFVGRAEDDGLDFSITFTDSNNTPIGTALLLSNYGGKPNEEYWTQYNFPIPKFEVNTASVGGIRIAQVSNGWGAMLYIDEMYLSTARGEDINPALPTPNPTETIKQPEIPRKYPPETNPFVYIIPAIFAILLIVFH